MTHLNKEQKQRIKQFRDHKIHISTQVNINKGLALECESPIRLDSDLAIKGFIGAYTYMRSGGRLSSGVKSIGRYCSIAPDVKMGDGNHPTDWLSTHPFQYGAAAVHTQHTKINDFDYLKPKGAGGKIIIGNDVWIGTDVKIMRGVVIGDGAIIAAGAIVTKNIPPYAIAAGVPAKVIKYRFEESIIKDLLEIKWWNYEADSLLIIPFNDVGLAIKEIDKLSKRNQLTEIENKKVIITGDYILNG